MADHTDNILGPNWEKLQQLDGKPFPELFDRIGLVKGFVVTTDIPENIKEKLKGSVYPLKALPNSHAEAVLNGTEINYQNETITLLVSDISQPNEWLCSLVYIDDFDKTPEKLMEEELEAQDSMVSCMKRCARLAMTGEGMPYMGEINSEISSIK